MGAIKLCFFCLILFPAYHVQGQKIDSFIEFLGTDISSRERIKTQSCIAMHHATNYTMKELHHRTRMDSIQRVENNTVGKFLSNGMDIRNYTNRNEEHKVKEELQENKLMLNN